MLVANAILGRVTDDAYSGRVVDRLPVAYHEAGKRRMRRTTTGGTDVAVDLPPHTHLADGAVLADDGRRIIVVERLPEPALVVRFRPGVPAAVMLEGAVRLGHAFGNQHAPLEVDGREVRVPLSTSEDVARRTVAALDLEGVEVRVADVAVGTERPLLGAHGHAHDRPEVVAPRVGDRESELLAVMQLSDSALPIGRFAHSNGLERWLQGTEAEEDAVAELIGSVLRQSTAPLDGVAIAHAHAAGDLAAAEALDRLVTAHKLTPGARLASVSCGRQLALLGVRLVEDPLLGAWARRVREGATDGNLAVAHGVLARAMGVGARQAVIVELRGVASGLLAAAVRLGRMSPSRAQLVQFRLTAAIREAADRAIDTPLSGMHSTAPELDIAAMQHERSDGRTFRT